MKTSTLVRNGVSPEMVEMISRLVALIPWPSRRQAMGDVTLTILDGKPRIAEKEFGWNRSGVTLGINEFSRGITCVNDLSQRHKPKSLPTVRTISNILNRHEYRLRTVAKTKVQKKRRRLTSSSKTSGK